MVPGAGDALVPGVTAHPLRHVGVGPERLGAGRRPGRVGGGHLPGQHERLGRHQPGRDLAQGLRPCRRRRRRRARCRGRTPAARPTGTGPLSAQSTLTVRRVEGEATHPRADPRGHVVGRSRPAAEHARRRRAGGRSRRRRRRGRQLVAAGGAHADRAAVAYDEPRHRRVAADLAALATQPPGQRLRSARPAPPRGTGKPTVWPSMLIRMPIRPEPGASSGMSVWPALPATIACSAAPPKRGVASSAAGRQQRRGRSPRPPALRQPRSSPQRRLARGGNGVSSPSTSGVADVVPLAAQLAATPPRRPGAASSARLAVTSRSRWSRPHEPSGIGCPRTAGACCHAETVLLEPEGADAPARPPRAGRRR